MRTNLAYIDEAAGKAAATAKENVRFAGFSFEREVETDQLRLYKSNAAELQRRLKEVGIEPLAILPRSWWQGILKGSKLIDVDISGRIKLAAQDGALLAHTIVSVLMMAVFFVAVTSVLAVATYNVMGLFGHWDHADAVMTAILIGAFTTTVYQLSWIRRLAAAKVVTWLLGDMLYEMWENKDGNTARHYEYDFPTPPADVASTLQKLMGRSFLNDYALKVRVASVPAAIALRNETQTSILAGIIQARYEEAKQRFINEINDPIVTVSYERAVAVVAQFGEFPIEKEIVDKVVGKGLRYDTYDD